MKFLPIIICLCCSISVFAQNPSNLIGRGYGETYYINLKTGEAYSQFKLEEPKKRNEDKSISYHYNLGMPFDVPFRLVVYPKDDHAENLKLYIAGSELPEFVNQQELELKSVQGEINSVVNKILNGNLDSAEVSIDSRLKSEKDSSNFVLLEKYNRVASDSAVYFVFMMPKLRINREYNFIFVENPIKYDEVEKTIEKVYSIEKSNYLNEVVKKYLSTRITGVDDDELLSKVFSDTADIRIIKDSLLFKDSYLEDIRAKVETALKKRFEDIDWSSGDINVKFKDDNLKNLMQIEIEHTRNILGLHYRLNVFFSSSDKVFFYKYLGITNVSQLKIYAFGHENFKTGDRIKNYNNSDNVLPQQVINAKLVNNKTFIDSVRLIKVTTSQDSILKYTLLSYLNEIRLELSYLVVNSEKYGILVKNTAKEIVGTGKTKNLEIKSKNKFDSNSHADYFTRTGYVVTADLGVAYVFGGKNYVNEIQPYFGVNFNFSSINRQVKYRLYNKREHDSWGKHFAKNTSLMMGVSFDTNGSSQGQNIQGKGNLYSTFSSLDRANPVNLYTGLGLRIADPIRLNLGCIWTKELQRSGTAEVLNLKPRFFLSLSYDLDVGKYLGRFKKSLYPE